MSRPALHAQVREILESLAALLAETDERARQARAERDAALAAAEQQFQRERSTRLAAFEAEQAAWQAESVRQRQELDHSLDEAEAAIRRRAAEELERIEARYESEQNRLKQAHDEACWEAAAVYEASRGGLKSEFDQALAQIGEAGQRTADIAAAAREQLVAYKQERLLEEVPQPLTGDVPAVREGQPAAAATAALARAEAHLTRLRELGVARAAAGLAPVLWLVMWLAAIALPVWLVFPRPAVWAAVTIPVAGLGWAVTLWVVRLLVRRRTLEVYVPLLQALAEAERARDVWKARLVRHYKHDRERHRAEKRRKRAAADAQYQRNLGELVAWHERSAQAVVAERDRALAELARRRESETARCDAQAQARLEESRLQYQIAWHAMHDRFDQARQQALSRYQRQHTEVLESWQAGRAKLLAHIDSLQQCVQEAFPAWDALAAQYQPPQGFPTALPVGLWHVPAVSLAEVLPEAEPIGPFCLPALVPFPQRPSLVFRAAGAGREQAVHAIQAALLRLLTSLPPGKVRFTVIDPVGLGQNFAAFMHLCDYDEQIIGGRIWTEPGQIEARLADLCEQMETIIQKYLRNEYATLDEYNAQAGEVAEPYRVLVIANFPVNFSEGAARRLLNIAASGPRCGVHLLVSVDEKQPLPPGFALADLEAHAHLLAWHHDAFQWQDPLFQPLCFQLAEPPDPETCTRLLRTLGQHLQGARRVEVPFARIAPPADSYWSASAAAGVAVPLGPAGATRLQYLRLGSGTAQHVLVAGKTGSGKSTLLHALITNLALTYSPDEVELYLVDFKKGVEFKTYAAHRLPHARVVAIESDREFGLSVLERLDAELKHRGDLFRALGVQDLAGYRRADGQPLPRILLVIDEFQEFFVEDDKLAQQAALLLDRLVRQGRAFGMHVLLGSQTLAGAYTLARSTLGQMAVRIALQCSEADAHLILSEENAAARLLSRPGEAIYNDAGGLVEANQPFQVAWIDDDVRERYLTEIQSLCQQRHAAAADGAPHAYPQIVFEGNVPAELPNNTMLSSLLAGQIAPSPLAPCCWLGEPVAIKEPTAARLLRASGRNLAVVGQQEETTLGMLAAAALSLVVQAARGMPGAALFVLDGSPAGSRASALWEQLAAAFPSVIRHLSFRDTTSLTGQLAAEADRRLQAREFEAPGWFCIIYDLGRLRDLRKTEDDFGFARSDQPLPPSRQWANVLRDGPGVGIHTLLWCDTWSNLQRALDRQALREFGLRVALQMSQADSSNWLDSPAASRLGLHRALLASEGEGLLEKFRPYSVPPVAWIEGLGARLQAAATPAGL
jgi:energy-coupling factor transporter ATP-binding protein EcfA2